MALCTSNYITSVVVAATVIWMQLLLITSAGAVGAECLDGGLVYPWGSMFWNPAMYGDVFQVSSVGSNQVFAPELDETNSTYNVRFVDDATAGANYRLVYTKNRGLSLAVNQSDAFYIFNVETYRPLAWRQEGEHEYFLVESDKLAALFQFSKASPSADNLGQALPSCPSDNPQARCEAYFLLWFPSSDGYGVTTYLENGVVYFKRTDDDDPYPFPFVLVRSSASASSAPVAIKMATTAA